MAKALGVTIEEILGLEPSGQKKRGPQSQLENQLAAIASLLAKNSSNFSHSFRLLSISTPEISDSKSR